MHRLSAFAACAAILAAHAQQPTPAPAPKQDDPPKIEKIEVQGDGLAERRESTASKLIVNRDEITRYGDTNVVEVLKRLPGITVDTGPGGRGATVRMRGLGAGYTQILVNGERMPPGFTLDSISPDLIERIEIVRGATAEFSTQAVAGTINVVLRRALSTQRIEFKPGVSAEHGKPSVNLTGQWSDRSGPFSWTVPVTLVRFAFASLGRSDLRAYDAGGDLVQRYLIRRPQDGWGGNFNTSPRVSWTLGPNNTLNLDAFLMRNFFRGHFIEDETPLEGLPPPYVATDLRVRNANTTARVNGQWVRRWQDGARLDAKMGATGFDVKSTSGYTADDVDGLRTLERTVDSTTKDLGFTTVGKYTFPIVKGNAVSSGWDAAWSTRDDTRLQQDRNPATGTGTRLDERFETTIQRLAIFAQDEWDVTERFAAYGGLRWEGIETRADGNNFAPIRNRSSVASPIANLLWKLPGTEKDQVRMGLSRTYRTPNIGELVPRRFFAPNNTPVTPDFIGNPNLRPELAWGLDTAYEHYPAGGGNVSVSVYHRRVKDIVQREVVFENGLYLSRPSNIGNGTVTGVELDAKGKLTQLWAGAPALDLRANFAVNRSKVDYLPGPDNRLDSQVPWNGTLGADYRFAGLPLTVGSSFTARAGGTVRLSPSQVNYGGVNRQLEAYALWRFSAASSVRFTVQNITAPQLLSVNRFIDANGTLDRTQQDPRFRRYALLWEWRA